MKKILILITILAGLVACGVKSPPVPWSSVVPKRIVDLQAVPRDGRLLLEWASPKENTDKSVVTDMAGFQILRSEGDLVAGECRGCGEKPKPIFEIRVGEKEDLKGKRMSAFIEDQEARKVYVYQVVSFNRRGYFSAPSNPVWVYWDNPPLPPGMIKGKSGDKRVDLSWEPVEDVTGYNIYRREEKEAFPTRPLNREPVLSTQYTDLNVENEKKYIYSVRAVKRVVKTDVEGRGSPEIAVTPTDLIPPSSPVGLVAIPLKNGIELNWRKNREPDLLGYQVYRKKQGEKEFKRLNETPLKKELYLDTDVELGEGYVYAVTAVDSSPHENESPLSEEVRVKYIY
jgi:fibronectin type 3 domain-containing protein